MIGRQESLDILEHKGGRTECSDKLCKTAHEAVPLIARLAPSAGGKALAWWSTDENGCCRESQFPTQVSTDDTAAYVHSVRPDRRGMFVHRADYLKPGLGKTQRETTTATEEINNREGKRHLSCNPLSIWGHSTPLHLRPHMMMALGPGEAVHWQ